MAKKYRRLREEDRGVINRMTNAGRSQTDIADAIGFSQSSVSKELSRNHGQRGYRHQQAQRKSDARKHGKQRRGLVIVGRLQDEVQERLRKKHSPEQISGKLKSEGVGISHETIYRYVSKDKLVGCDLYKNLRINGKRRYRSRSKVGRVGKTEGRVGIEERPMVVQKRCRHGDREIDLISGAGGSGYLLSLYERKSRLGKLAYLKDKGAVGTAEAIIKTLTTPSQR